MKVRLVAFLGRRTNLCCLHLSGNTLPQASGVHAQECIRLRFYGCFQGYVGDSVEPRTFEVSHFCACLSQFFYCDGRNNLVIPPLQWDFAAGLLREERFNYPLQKHWGGWCLTLQSFHSQLVESSPYIAIDLLEELISPLSLACLDRFD